jgi:hypothetical protein
MIHLNCEIYVAHYHIVALASAAVVGLSIRLDCCLGGGSPSLA